MEKENVTLFPVGLKAAREALEKFNFGDVIPMTWLHEHFEIETPAVATPEEFKTLQFKFLTAMDQFRDELLLENKMALQNVRGTGYRIVQPAEQTSLAIDGFRKRISKECGKAQRHLENIRFDLLDTDQRQSNIDARMRISMVEGMNKRRLPVGFSIEETKLVGNKGGK